MAQIGFANLIYGILFGVLPSILWLFFWLREDNLHPEPRSILARTFLFGILATICVIPLQFLTQSLVRDGVSQYWLWSASEEILKLIFAYMAAIHTKYLDEPIDAVIYMITVSLGFSAMENIFFLLAPMLKGDIVSTLISGNMRFVGATLLHVISSSCVGIMYAFAYYKSKKVLTISIAFGLILAITLHAFFNLFIINGNTTDIIKTFALVWFGAIGLLLVFEKIKTIKPAQGLYN